MLKGGAYMSEEFSEIIYNLQRLEKKRVGIFTHQNADPDAVASVVGLKYLLEQLIPNIEIKIFIKSTTILSRNLFSIFNEEILEDFSISEIDAFFLCDSNNPQQTGFPDLENHLAEDLPVFIIDHHSDHEFTKHILHKIILPITSTAEIIAFLFKESDVTIPSDIATLLIAGILFDTRRFIHVSESTFSTIIFLIDSGGNYENALSMLQFQISESERIARLKGATRLKIYRDESFIIVSSYVSTFESSVARALIELGANCSIVLSNPDHNEFRISFRCTRSYADKNELNLGDISNNLAIQLGGSGGGHKTAAGMNFTQPVDFPKQKEKQLDYIVDLFLREIKKSK